MSEPIRLVVEASATGSLSIRALNADLQALERAASRVSLFRGIGANASELNRFQNEISGIANTIQTRFSRAINVAANEMERFYNFVGSAGRTVFYTFAAGITLAAYELQKLGRAFLDVNEKYRGFETVIKSIYGSQSIADTLRNKVVSMTATSPLPYSGLAELVRSMSQIEYVKNSISKQVGSGQINDPNGFTQKLVRLGEQMVAMRPDKDVNDAIFAIREFLTGRDISVLRRFGLSRTGIEDAAGGKSMTEILAHPELGLQGLQGYMNRLISPTAIQDLNRLPSKLFQNIKEQIVELPMGAVGQKGIYDHVIDFGTRILDQSVAFVKVAMEPAAQKLSDVLIHMFDSVLGGLKRTYNAVATPYGLSQDQNPGLSMIEILAKGATKVVDNLSDKLPGFIDKTVQFFSNAVPLLIKFTEIVGGLLGSFASNMASSPILTTLTTVFLVRLPEILRQGALSISRSVITATVAGASAQLAGGSAFSSGYSSVTGRGQSILTGLQGIFSGRSAYGNSLQLDPVTGQYSMRPGYNPAAYAALSSPNPYNAQVAQMQSVGMHVRQNAAGGYYLPAGTPGSVRSIFGTNPNAIGSASISSVFGNWATNSQPTSFLDPNKMKQAGEGASLEGMLKGFAGAIGGMIVQMGLVTVAMAALGYAVKLVTDFVAETKAIQMRADLGVSDSMRNSMLGDQTSRIRLHEDINSVSNPSIIGADVISFGGQDYSFKQAKDKLQSVEDERQKLMEFFGDPSQDDFTFSNGDVLNRKTDFRSLVERASSLTSLIVAIDDGFRSAGVPQISTAMTAQAVERLSVLTRNAETMMDVSGIFDPSSHNQFGIKGFGDVNVKMSQLKTGADATTDPKFQAYEKALSEFNTPDIIEGLGKSFENISENVNRFQEALDLVQTDLSNPKVVIGMQKYRNTLLETANELSTKFAGQTVLFEGKDTSAEDAAKRLFDRAGMSDAELAGLYQKNLATKFADFQSQAMKHAVLQVGDMLEEMTKGFDTQDVKGLFAERATKNIRGTFAGLSKAFGIEDQSHTVGIGLFRNQYESSTTVQNMDKVNQYTALISTYQKYQDLFSAGGSKMSDTVKDQLSKVPIVGQQLSDWATKGIGSIFDVAHKIFDKGIKEAKDVQGGLLATLEKQTRDSNASLYASSIAGIFGTIGTGTSAASVQLSLDTIARTRADYNKSNPLSQAGGYDLGFLAQDTSKGRDIGSRLNQYDLALAVQKSRETETRSGMSTLAQAGNYGTTDYEKLRVTLAGILDDENKIIKAKEQILGVGSNPATQFAGGFTDVSNTYLAEMGNFQKVGNETATALTNNLGNAFTSLANRTKTAGEAFKSFGINVLNSMEQIASNKLAASLIGGLFGTGSGSLLGFFSGGSGGMTTTGNASTLITGHAASGAILRGGSGTKDDLLIMAMGGEGIVRKSAVQYYGEDYINKMNAMQIPRGYAYGGIVGGSSPSYSSGGGDTYHVETHYHESSGSATTSSKGSGSGRDQAEALAKAMNAAINQWAMTNRRQGGMLSPNRIAT